MSITRRGQYSFQLRIYLGEVAGEKKYKTQTLRFPKGSTEAYMQKEAEKAHAALSTDVSRGMVSTANQISLFEFAKEWMELYCKEHLSPVTYNHYKTLLNGRILPALGAMKLEKIRPKDIMAFYKGLYRPGVRKDGKADKPLSEKTIKDYHACLSSMFNTAVKMEYIVKNPMDGVTPPKVQRKEMSSYTPDQAMIMLEALTKEPLAYQTAVNLALFCGLRLGEIAGLEFKDIDFDAKSIRISRSSKYIQGQGIITKAPKTQSSNRTVFIPDHLIPILKNLKKEKLSEKLQKANLWEDNDRLMTQWNGQPINPDSISKWWRKFQDSAGLTPYLRFHDLRHTCATLQVAMGVDIKSISANLGHSLTSTTMDIYAHAIEQNQRAGVDALESMLIQAK